MSKRGMSKRDMSERGFFEHPCLPTYLFFPMQKHENDPMREHGSSYLGAEFDNACERGVRVFWGVTIAIACIGGGLLAAAFIINALIGGGSHLPEAMLSFAALFIKDGAMTSAGVGTTVAVCAAAAPSVLTLLGGGVIVASREILSGASY